ncbi:MAG TPA: VOC family protein [Sphingobium sp.]
MTSGITPHITIRDGRAAAAIAFYETAFGAVEMIRVMADDNHRIIFAQLQVNGGMMMLSDQFGESDCAAGQAPVHVEGIVIHLQVDDADAWWERALAAGAQVHFPIGPQFWGDRYGQVADPFGYIWSIGSPTTAH